MSEKLKPWIWEKVRVIRILDADTLVIEIEQDIGFEERVIRTLKLRIRHYDAPETWRPRNDEERAHGKLATQYANDLLIGRNIKVLTYKKGKYGRYEADIILESGHDFVETMKGAGFQKRESY